MNLSKFSLTNGMIFDRLNSDKKRFDLLRGGYCVGDTGPGCFFYGETLTVGVEFGKTQLGVKRTSVLLRGGIARVMLAPVFYFLAKNAEIFWIFLRKSLKNN